MAKPSDFTNEQLEEIIKCYRDPAYFIEKYAVPALDYYKAPVKLADHQKRWINQMLVTSIANINLDIVDRQTYGTTTILAMMAWILIFKANHTALYCGHNHFAALSAKNLLSDMLQELPSFLQPNLTVSNKQELASEVGARVVFEVAGRNTGRGRFVQYCFMDQLAAFSHDGIDGVRNMIPCFHAVNSKVLAVVNTNVHVKYNGWMELFADPSVEVNYVNRVR